MSTGRASIVLSLSDPGRTSTIRIGSVIAYAFGRPPLVMAAEARDGDGRLINECWS